MGRRSAPAVGAGRGRRLGSTVDDPGRLATGKRPAAAGNAAGDAVVQLARRAAGARRRLQLAGQVDRLLADRRLSPPPRPSAMGRCRGQPWLGPGPQPRRQNGSPMKRPRTNAGPLLPIRQGKRQTNADFTELPIRQDTLQP